MLRVNPCCITLTEFGVGLIPMAAQKGSLKSRGLTSVSIFQYNDQYVCETTFMMLYVLQSQYKVMAISVLDLSPATTARTKYVADSL